MRRFGFRAAGILGALAAVLAGLRVALPQGYQCLPNYQCINWVPPQCWGQCGVNCEVLKNTYYTNNETTTLASPGPCQGYWNLWTECWQDVNCAWGPLQSGQSCQPEVDGYWYCRWSVPGNYCSECWPYGPQTMYSVLSYTCWGCDGT